MIIIIIVVVNLDLPTDDVLDSLSNLLSNRRQPFSSYPCQFVRRLSVTCNNFKIIYLDIIIIIL